jgi:hypothetical protein
MEEDLYDGPFPKRHTNMPFLGARDDSGEWRPVAEPEGRPLVTVQDAAEVRVLEKLGNDNREGVERGSLCLGLKPPAAVMVKGRRVRTVLEAQLGELAGYTPDWAA